MITAILLAAALLLGIAACGGDESQGAADLDALTEDGVAMTLPEGATGSTASHTGSSVVVLVPGSTATGDTTIAPAVETPTTGEISAGTVTTKAGGASSTATTADSATTAGPTTTAGPGSTTSTTAKPGLTTTTAGPTTTVTSPGSTTTTEPRFWEWDDDENGQTKEIRVGDHVVIELNPTMEDEVTSIEWANSPPAILDEVGEGSGKGAGVYYYVYKEYEAIAPGTVAITATLRDAGGGLVSTWQLTLVILK
jgi:hypothetical protein